MGRLVCTTRIKSPPQRCFNLATSIDLHKLSAAGSQEEAISGRTRGLIKAGETVSWRAKHFGFWFTLTSQITYHDRPRRFVDEMLAGPFKYLHHTHEFVAEGEETLMTDTFIFSSPLGVLGKLVDYLVLNHYLEQFLRRRNQLIKAYAESEQWKSILKQ